MCRNKERERQGTFFSSGEPFMLLFVIGLAGVACIAVYCTDWGGWGRGGIAGVFVVFGYLMGKSRGLAIGRDEGREAGITEGIICGWGLRHNKEPIPESIVNIGGFPLWYYCTALSSFECGRDEDNAETRARKIGQAMCRFRAQRLAEIRLLNDALSQAELTGCPSAVSGVQGPAQQQHPKPVDPPPAYPPIWSQAHTLPQKKRPDQE